jgi:uncharacterized membrane protein
MESNDPFSMSLGSGGKASPRSGLLDRVLGAGWKTFTEAWGLLLVASLVIIAGGIPGQVVSQIGQLIGQAIGQGGGAPAAAGVVFLGATALSFSLSVAIQWPAQVGASMAALAAARGDTKNFGATLAGFRQWGKSVLVMLLVTLFVALAVLPGIVPVVIGVALAISDSARGGIGPMGIIGFILIAIGGLLAIAGSMYVSARLLLAPTRALDPQMPAVSAFEAIKLSWSATRGHVLPIIGVLLLSGVVFILGLLACCVGILLFAMPLWLSWIAHTYRALFDPPEPATMPWAGEAPPTMPV